MQTRACVVILCGGSGTRLWPVSRPCRPKQFTDLLGQESLFVHTAHRALGAGSQRDLLVVAGNAHQAAIREQLTQSQLEGRLLIEPEARDSGPAIAAAAAFLAAESPDTVMVVLASDHFIPDIDAFQRSLAVAEASARAGNIVTLGIMPDAPSTAYGYIRPAAPPQADNHVPVLEFREKPDRDTAEQFMRDGYLWNSGNFVATAGNLFAAFERFEPELAAAARRAAAEGRENGSGIATRLGPSFHDAKKISIDFAVMERADNVAVVPVAWSWSDLGAWDAVHAVSDKDAAGNALVGDVIALNTQGSFVRAMPGMVVATSGIENLAVVADRDAVLVCRLDAAQSVKQVVDALKKEARPEVDLPPARQPKPNSVVAREWRSWLFTKALTVWWCFGADHVGGGFREGLTLTGEPAGESRRCRVQSRQAYVYALAGAAGWAGPWQQAVRHGLEALDRFYRRDDGLYRTLVSNDGSPLDETAKLYDQAFVLLALAAGRTCLPDADARALRLLDALAVYRHAGGGFRENEDQPFQSNPHMHLFEACLAWCEVPGSDSRWKDLAAEIAALTKKHFIVPEGGALREFFGPDWKPAEGEAGERIEPGHQFEWAWLLERWARLSGSAASAQAAEVLFAAGLRGIDPQRGVALNAVLPGGTPLDDGARLWPQTEWLKAANLFARRKTPLPGASEFDISRAMQALQRYLAVPVEGLWHDCLKADGQFLEGPSPASSFYHIAEAILALGEGSTR